MSDARPWTNAALFGALWGTMEISLGGILHLSRFPLRGIIMAVLGLLCLVVLRRLSPVPGVCIMAGFVAAFLKIFALGGLIPGPLLGILIEALLLELLWTLVGLHLISSIIGGAMVLMLTPLQMAFMVWISAGSKPLEALGKLLADLFVKWNLPPPSLFRILIDAAGISAVVGGLAGWWAWRVGARVLRRMDGRS